MKICIITLGCKVNSYESESLIKSFVEAGYAVTAKLEPAEIYIINSCAVTNEAEHKSRGVIAKINKLNHNAKIYVCGCSSQLHPDSYLNKQNVVAVIGTEAKNNLVEIISNNKTGNMVSDISLKYNDNYASYCLNNRVYIKIQDGCNNFCSFCIIPFTRGRERSRTLEEINSELAKLNSRVKEVVLVGINMAAYGKDLSPKTDLSEVVDLFKSYPNLRLRFSSLELGTITTKFLKSLTQIKNFCPFFHISLQSGADSCLKAMNRKHNFNDYYMAVKKILTYFPNANISTDIIVGFPTETEENFNESLNNLSKINFGKIHAFPYSKRDGTASALLQDLNGGIKKERLGKLQKLADELRKNYILGQINLNEEVLVEGKKGDYYTGFTKTYIKCYIKSCTDLVDRVVTVKIIKPYLDGILGIIN